MPSSSQNNNRIFDALGIGLAKAHIATSFSATLQLEILQRDLVKKGSSACSGAVWAINIVNTSSTVRVAVLPNAIYTNDRLVVT